MTLIDWALVASLLLLFYSTYRHGKDVGYEEAIQAIVREEK